MYLEDPDNLEPDSADSSASPSEWLVVAGLTGGIGLILLWAFVGGLAIPGLLLIGASLFSYFLSAAIEYIHDALEGEPRAHDTRGRLTSPESAREAMLNLSWLGLRGDPLGEPRHSSGRHAIKWKVFPYCLTVSIGAGVVLSVILI